MKLQKSTVLFLALSTLLTSCASLYVPNSVNTPLLSEKKEAVINVNTGMNGWDLQGAFSPIDKLGIMVNTSGSPVLSKSQGYHGHTYIEGGLGYYTSFGTNGIFEVYTGGGYGNSKTKSVYTVNGNSRSDKVEGVGIRYFIQPSIGAKKDKAELSFSLRTIYTELRNVKYDNSTTLHQRFGAYIEPAFTIRTGNGPLKFHSQIGASLPISSATTKIRYRPLLMSFGITIRIVKN